MTMNEYHIEERRKRCKSPWQGGRVYRLRRDLKLYHVTRLSWSCLMFKQNEEVIYVGCREIERVFCRVFRHNDLEYVLSDEYNYVIGDFE